MLLVSGWILCSKPVLYVVFEAVPYKDCAITGAEVVC